VSRIGASLGDNCVVCCWSYRLVAPDDTADVVRSEVSFAESMVSSLLGGRIATGRKGAKLGTDESIRFEKWSS